MKESDITIQMQQVDEDATGPEKPEVFAKLLKRRNADLQGAIGFNLGSLDVLPLSNTRGFTPFRDRLMIQHLEAGGTLAFLDTEGELNINEKFKELLARAEVRTVSPEVFDRIQELSKQPAEPSPALIDLVTRKRKFKREY